MCGLQPTIRIPTTTGQEDRHEAHNALARVTPDSPKWVPARRVSAAHRGPGPSLGLNSPMKTVSASSASSNRPWANATLAGSRRAVGDRVGKGEWEAPPLPAPRSGPPPARPGAGDACGPVNTMSPSRRTSSTDGQGWEGRGGGRQRRYRGESRERLPLAGVQGNNHSHDHTTPHAPQSSGSRRATVHKSQMGSMADKPMVAALFVARLHAGAV